MPGDRVDVLAKNREGEFETILKWVSVVEEINDNDIYYVIVLRVNQFQKTKLRLKKMLDVCFV